MANKRSSSAATTFTTKLGHTYVDKGYQKDFLFELPPGEGVCFIEESYGYSDETCPRLWGFPVLKRGDPLREFFGYKGDPKGFEEENLVIGRYDDLPCCPKGLTSTYGTAEGSKPIPGTFRCHRKILPYLRNALAQIFKWAAESPSDKRYELRGIGTYCHRDVNGRPGHLSNHALGIAIDINATQNGQGSPVWDMPVEIVHIMRDNGFFWGGVYPMDKGEARQDAMHFDYRRDGFPPISFAPSLSMPLSTGLKSSAPVKIYRNVETADTGAGGYYTMGLHRNIHGGVHLVPEDAKTVNPVRSVAPGYIVAVRLPRMDKANSASTEAAKNWTGFVLVRHDVRLRKKTEDPFDTNLGGAFYSLYMHLAPLRSEDLEQDNYASAKYGVTWVQSLLKRRFGTFTSIVDTAKVPVGTTYWAAEPYVAPSPAGKEWKIYGQAKVQKVAPVSKEGRTEWLFKSGPVDLKKVAEAIAAGRLVTFNEPFFTVDEGDVIGILAPRPQPSKGPQPSKEAQPSKVEPSVVSYKYTDAKGAQRKADLPQRFLHWEIFAPIRKGKSTLQDLLSVANGAKKMEGEFPADNVIKEIVEDNFLDLGELRQKVLPRLPADEQSKLKEAVDWMESIEKRLQQPVSGCPSRVIGFFADGATFAPRSDCDSKGDFVKGDFTYPMQLQLEYEHLAAPDRLASGKPYSLDIAYSTVVGSGIETVIGKQTLAIDAAIFKGRSAPDPEDKRKEVLSLNLHVPAQADRIRFLFEGQAIHLTNPRKASEEDGATLLAAMAKARWRGTRIEHISEWTPKAVEALFKKSKDLNLLPADEELEAYARVSWWQTEASNVQRDKAKTPDDVANGIFRADDRETIKAVGDKNEVFGKELPTDAHVDNLHPVTAMWLLAILGQRRLAEIAVPKRAVFDPEDPDPLAMGWIVDDKAPNPKLGDPVHALIVDEDFGYDHDLRVTVTAERSGLSLPVVSQHGYGENGVIAKALVADFWGDWHLAVQGAKRTPAILGKKVLSIAGPELRDTSQNDAKAGRHLPRRHGRAVFWNVKLESGSPVPSQLAGFVGIEVSAVGAPWAEPTVGGHPLCIFATCIGAAASDKQGVHVMRDKFEIVDESIVGVASTCKEANPQVTKSLRLQDYRRAQTDLHVACSLVDALVQAGCVDDDVRSVDRGGTVCVLRPKAWQPLWHLAVNCLQSKRFSHVGIPTENVLLTVEELAEHAQGPGSRRMAKLATLGLKLGIQVPLATLGDCELLTGAEIQTSQDGCFVAEARVKKAKLAKDGTLTTAAFVGKAPIRLSTLLAEGLEELHGKAKKPIVPARLSWEGDICELADGSLLDSALDIPAFVHVDVVTRGKDKHLRVAAPAAHGMTLIFDPSALLSEIVEDQMKSGALQDDKAELDYRYYFCAVNGLGLRHPEGYPSESGIVLQRDWFGVTALQPPQVAASKCLPVCGTLRRRGVGTVQAHAVESKVEVVIPLLGNRLQWVGGRVEVSIKGQQGGGKPSKPQAFPLPEAVFDVRVEVPRPKGDALTVEVAAFAKDETEPFALKSTTLSLGPHLKSKLMTAEIEDAIAIWCRVEGAIACRASASGLVLAGETLLALQPAKRQAKGKSADEFILTVKPQGGGAPLAADCHLPTDPGSGHVSDTGVFAARVRRTLLDWKRLYDVTLAYRSASKPKDLVSMAQATLSFHNDKWMLDPK